MPIRPVDLKQATGEARSIYEAIVIMSFRARQINDELRANLQARIAEVAIPNDDDTEIANPDQLEVAREFDHIPKPTFLALDEMLDGDLEYRYREPQY